jgi:hypothetical protein
MPDLINTRMDRDECYLVMDGDEVGQAYQYPGDESAGLAIAARLAALWNLALGVPTEGLETLEPGALANLCVPFPGCLAVIRRFVELTTEGRDVWERDEAGDETSDLTPEWAAVLFDARQLLDVTREAPNA